MIYLNRYSFLPRQPLISNSHSSLDKTNNFEMLLRALQPLCEDSTKCKLELALSESYTVQIEPMKWTYQLDGIIHSTRTDKQRQEDRILYLPKFENLTEPISDYLDQTSPLCGTFIKLCFTRNKLLRDALTIFKENVIRRKLTTRTRAGSEMVTASSSLRFGLQSFTVLTASYPILKNFVLESSSILLSFLEHLAIYENGPSCVNSLLLQKLHSTLETLVLEEFLTTLAPKRRAQVIPLLYECSCHDQNCSVFALEDADIVELLPDSLHEILLSHGLAELAGQLDTLLGISSDQNPLDKDELSKKRLQWKELMLRLRNIDIKRFFLAEHVDKLLSRDAIDLFKVVLEDGSLPKEVCIELQKKLNEIRWMEKVRLTETFLIIGDS